MFNAKQLINELISQNPNIKNNANASEMINCVLNNDSKRGEMLANNLLQTYGVSREDAIKMAKQKFNIG